MKISRFLIFTLGLALLVSATMFLYKINSKSSDKLYNLTVNVSGATKKYSLESNKDGYVGLFFGEKNTIKLSEGKHEVVAKSEGLSDVKISVNIEKDNQNLDIVFTGMTADSRVKQQNISNLEINVIKAKYFSQDTWVAGLINSSSSNSETEIIVLKKVKDDWETVDQGTYLDIDYLKSIGAPADLMEYVKSLQ